MATNWLLGKAERLMKPIPAPGGGGEKKHPYSFGRAQERLLEQLPDFSAALAKMPEEACPNRRSVALLTVHPAYLAKSYFPLKLLDETGLRSVGSRRRIMVPETPSARHTKGDRETALELFVEGPRSQLLGLGTWVRAQTEQSAAANDLRKIERIELQDSQSKVRVAPYDPKPTCWEAVLHATASRSGDEVLSGFAKFVAMAGGQVDLERRIYAGGLCFMPVYGDRAVADAVAPFCHLRVIRGMPRVRPITRSIGTLETFDCKVPDRPSINSSIRVTIFDGGPVDIPSMNRWVRNVEPQGIAGPQPEFREHAIGVASAALFGPIIKGRPLPAPFADIDVVRVLDRQTPKDGPDYFDVLKRIDSYLADNECDFVNLSLGPDWPVEDDEPHAWTAVLDQRLSEKPQLLAFCAVGNNGHEDWESGNARVQPPSDCVNAVAIGSCDGLGAKWSRSGHSCIGPGRSPGIIRPELLAFGGEDKNKFFVLGTAEGTAVPVIGTSYASPTAMRTAVGVRALLGQELGALAIRALLINRSSNLDKHSKQEVGWGRIEHTVEELIKSDDHTAHIVYQKTISPGQWLSAEVPLPDTELKGNVELCATFCFAASTDPQHTINYTRAGLEVVFRPHSERFDVNSETQQKSKRAKSRSFFSLGTMYRGTEAELRDDAHKWETVLHERATLRGSSLRQPTFEIHYHTRDEGQVDTANTKPMPFALVLTIRCKSEPKLYDKIVTRYPGLLQQIQPIRLTTGFV